MSPYQHKQYPERAGSSPASDHPHARSALFIDPMLLRSVARAGVIIIAAIPVTTGKQGVGARR